MTKTKMAAANRKLVIDTSVSQRLHQKGFLRCQLVSDRLALVEAVDHAKAMNSKAMKSKAQTTGSGNTSVPGAGINKDDTTPKSK